MKMIIKQVEGFYAEPLKVEDHDNLWRLWNHPEIIPRRGKGTKAPFLEFSTWLANKVLFPANNFIYGLKYSGFFIGCLSYELHENSIDIHILIHPSYQGEGLGPEAIKGTLGWVFLDWGNKEVFAGIVSDNEPAIKMFKKLGFEYRGENTLKNERKIVGYSLKP